MYFLFLDDERHWQNIAYPEDVSTYEVVTARNFSEFQSVLRTRGIPAVISLDHDLADQHYIEGRKHSFTSFDYSKVTEKTGLHCAHLLVEECKKLKQKLPRWFVHSFNPVGKANIIRFLQNAEKTLTNS